MTRFHHPVRIYYEDTDAGGVVYYANYLKFFERCRTEWLRSLGHNQTDLLAAADIVFVVKSVSADYKRPARLDDHLEAGLLLTHLGRAQLQFDQWVDRLNPDGTRETLVTGSVKLACVNLKTLRPVSIPDWLHSQLQPSDAS
jgi:acyl-CoA thioester hydrolase